ncbi:YadA C-terminal domain-containing protein [Streptobacillus moniliformis]|uniref:YadA C-terminal domain-containing protein n=1 Tax=Streptobacillus moniliformis TaxID=34105 RepID=UPI0007E3EF94|nr:YadA C-terminal domain-containing protein [Streptobacillus moniliformis]
MKKYGIITLLSGIFLFNIGYSSTENNDKEIYDWLKNMRDIDKNADLNLDVGGLGEYKFAFIPQLKKILQVKVNKDASNLDSKDIDKWKEKLGIKNNENTYFTKSQFDKLNNSVNTANSGVASAIATASTIKNLGNKKHTISGSIGYYGKEVAGAIAYSTHYKNFGFGANASFNSRLEVGAGLGLSYTFGKDEDKRLQEEINSLRKIVEDIVTENKELRNSIKKYN